MAPEFSEILYMGHGPRFMGGSRILWNIVHGAWAKVYGWLQHSLEFCICGMSQGLWVAPEFFGFLYMGHGPGSMDGSRILRNYVHGACAKVYGWLQNSLESCTWGMGQGLWMAPDFSEIL